MAKKRKTLPKEIKALLEGGDIQGVKELLLRCEPNAVTGKYGSNIFSLTPLPRELALWAKEQGADVDFLDYYDRTPIFDHASAWNGDVRLLLELGARPDVADHFGITPLHLASLYGRPDAVRALLEAGMDANIPSGRLDSFGYMTPLEKTLLQNRLPYERLLKICTILLDHGAKITGRCREYMRKSAEQFQRNKRVMKDLEYLRSQTEGLEKLYKLFDIQPPPEVPFHDGVSPILVPEAGEDAQFQQLWDFLVPPSGRAQTAQGEIIRIAGRVENELMGNGGINWDEDFRKMLRAFPQYVRLGNAFSQDDIQAAEVLTGLLTAAGDEGRIDDFLCGALCDCAVAWVRQNPNPLPPLEGDYKR